MANLLELSHELLHCIFTSIGPRDLPNLSLSCRTFRNYIAGNNLLFRELYLQRYDDYQREGNTDWCQQVHDTFKLEKILASDQTQDKRDQLEFVAKHIDRLMYQASTNIERSRNVKLLSDLFHDRQDNIDVFLCSSSLFEVGRAGVAGPGARQVAAATAELRQASAKLHCLYGVPIDVAPRNTIFSMLQPDLTLGPSSCTRSQNCRHPATHPWARSKVYDLRQYTQDSLWGPFCNDGSQRVDWEKVEAVMIVLNYNLRKFSENSIPRFHLIWREPFKGASPGSYHSPSDSILPVASSAAIPPSDHPREIDEILEIRPWLEALDPYGVTGTWMRVVCFLDYNDLYAFNFASGRIPEDQPRDAIDKDEAIRLIRIKLSVWRVDPPDTVYDARDPWAEDDSQTPPLDWSNFKGTRLPVVHFRGLSQSMHASWDPNANSMIRGTVRQTPEGEIRWTTFSIFHGEERWRSEGIQIGGLRSARGVLGNWFDKDYDRHGPAGPTAFWKETDGFKDEEPRLMHFMH